MVFPFNRVVMNILDNTFQVLRRYFTPYYGSNRISRRLRHIIEHMPIKQIVGVNLAGLTFFTAVVMPQAKDVTIRFEVNTQTSYTPIYTETMTESLQWPFNLFVITQKYSYFHPAIDLQAPVGTSVYPIKNGVVKWTKQDYVGYGKHLLIEHNKHLHSLYAHLSRISVTQGQYVQNITQLGEAGATGWATGPHLHLEIYEDGRAVNPLDALPELAENK